ncbi:TetR/AcrR family transcriptional regulator [Marinomonas sp. A79]|uniref:TetR/AcrR family transcriptional regulator n=1 Tax=Marinomonas vulgaris TaxID=2823372 RepID=A0ABS5HFM6_9GAMM|nr:TetR/AcrR family transcriptional regulator [Marinomonas vulgaris]MBR7890284.1 TetR/AcrR family transcriptional regulator [Marinomonas vulgaris]
MARGRPSKKAHIVSAAGGLFTKQGYQSTSIDQVVQTAAVSKPTVYSNFPTKLVLWEEVLIALIEASHIEMQTCLDKLKKHTDRAFTDGWITLWETWVNKPEHLAVYRIMLGEQHKMQPSTFALFAEFEAVLEAVLLDWVDFTSVKTENLFAMKAVSREALLTPALMNLGGASRSDFVRYIKNELDQY